MRRREGPASPARSPSFPAQASLSQPSRPAEARRRQGSGLGPGRPRATPPAKARAASPMRPGHGRARAAEAEAGTAARTQLPPGPERALQRGAALRRRAPWASLNPRHGRCPPPPQNLAGKRLRAAVADGPPPARRGTTVPSRHLGPGAARGRRRRLAAGLAGSQPTPHTAPFPGAPASGILIDHADNQSPGRNLRGCPITAPEKGMQAAP